MSGQDIVLDIWREYTWTALWKYTDALKSILDNQSYEGQLMEYRAYLRFEIGKEEHILIREFIYKEYYIDPIEERGFVFSDDNYLNQEILVPKMEFVHKMLNCIERYVEYEYLFEDLSNPIMVSNLKYWEKEITEIKEKIKTLEQENKE